MNRASRFILPAAACFLASAAMAFEYTVTKPAICPRWSGAVAGEWTMDYDAALANAKSEGACAIVMFTGSWWCPYCETLEAKVLTSQAWRDYVSERGYYLAQCDYPYRFPVPEGQEWKGVSDLGDGWGFKCWLYDADYLSANGLTAEEGLVAIQEMYDYQDSIALPGSTVNTIARYGGGTMDLHKIGYPTFVVFRPDGSEAGRLSFPWYRESAVSDEDAIDYVIGNLEIIRNSSGGGLYEDPTEGGLQGTQATEYLGWIEDGETGEVAGTVTVKAAKAKKKTGMSKLTATFVSSRKVKVKLTGEADTPSTNKVFVLTKKGSSATAGVKLGANGMVGYFTDADGRSYSIKGGRNVFSAKDTDAKARAAELKQGFWTVAITNGVSNVDFARGAGALSITVKSKGKAKVSGWLGDGTKVSASAKAIMGDNGKFVIPVTLPLYSKKGGISFLAVVESGLLTRIDGLSDWVAGGKNAFTVSVSARHAKSPGFGALPDVFELEVPSLVLHKYGILDEGLFAEFDPSAKKWKVEGASEDSQSPFTMSMSFTAKTGLAKGSLTIKAPTGKKVKASVYVVVVDGVGYGTAVFKSIGSWRVKFASSCGGEGC